MMADAELDRDVLANNQRHVEIYFRSLAEDRAPSPAEIDELAEAGRRRLHQGVPLESMFHAYRVGSRVLWQCLLEVADSSDSSAVSPPSRSSSRTWSALPRPRSMRRSASAVPAPTRRRRASSSPACWPATSTMRLRSREGRNVGFDLDRTHVVALVTARHQPSGPNVQHDLELVRGWSQLQRYLPDSPSVAMRAGLVVAVPVESAQEAASTVQKALGSLMRDNPPSIGMGTPRSGPAGIVQSFGEARRALALGSILQPNAPVSRYDELQLFDLFRAGDPVNAFVAEVLGKLLTRDRTRGSTYLSNARGAVRGGDEPQDGGKAPGRPRQHAVLPHAANSGASRRFARGRGVLLPVAARAQVGATDATVRGRGNCRGLVTNPQVRHRSSTRSTIGFVFLPTYPPTIAGVGSMA